MIRDKFSKLLKAFFYELTHKKLFFFSVHKIYFDI